ncbi:peptidase M16 family protein [Salegentibacter maritimus]|uniref:hypothetical protein n=1 Tax=Salegentibacter maritimus TaxID=2794347 RepID=UPI0018E40592|nr:hypothetical protein [Salegentibacter maritimus]MBI6118260.1 hypothetical protein [Salegentibacter maritimus]
MRPINAIFDCIPEELPLIREDYRIIISELKKELITEEFLAKCLKRKKYLYDSKGRAKSNKSISEKLYLHYRFGAPLIEDEEKENFIEKITPEDIRETAQKYLKEKHFFEFAMNDRNKN